MGISPMQLLIILRNMGGDLGGAVKGFKKAMKDEDKASVEKKDAELIEGEAEKVDSNKEKDQQK